MARVMSTRMDRGRPLWEYWFVEGLADGRWAFLSKLHHSMVDGVSGSEIFRLILDPTPEPGPAIEDDWQPESPPSSRTCNSVNSATALCCEITRQNAPASGDPTGLPSYMIEVAP